jgi:hypothetical protein
MSDQELTVFHYRQEIYAMFREALSADLRSVDVRAQDLHDRVAGQPTSNQDAILCCDVMRTLFNPLAGDLVVRDTDAGCELELTVKYAIPRPEWGTWR